MHRCQHRGPTPCNPIPRLARRPPTPHMTVPRSREEPAGHRLGARYARRGRSLAALILPAQLAHHTPIPTTLLAHRTLMITLINRQPPRTRPGRHTRPLGHLRHHTHSPPPREPRPAPPACPNTTHPTHYQMGCGAAMPCTDRGCVF